MGVIVKKKNNCMKWPCGSMDRRCELQVAGQDFTQMWKELEGFFVLLFHTYTAAQKKKNGS